MLSILKMYICKCCRTRENWDGIFVPGCLVTALVFIEVSSKLSNTTITMLTTSIYTPAVIFASYVYDLV